jgi:methylthioribose-1-phosphate isomerase
VIEPRALSWTEPGLRLLDQTRLPHETLFLDIETVDQLIDAVQRLAVRGAPALGASGGYGVVIAMDQAGREGWAQDHLEDAFDRIRDARPTAVNLAWGVERVRKRVPEGRDAVLAEAHAIAREDADANRASGRFGADWLLEQIGDRPLRLLTHCNTGMLATSEWGTALGVVRELAERGRIEMVYADETRPLLQGARLTAWELNQFGIEHRVIADSAAASTILRGEVDAALIGADRVAANGDTANKIGSVGVALACAAAGIPFMVVAPLSTVDLATASGNDIHIELRNEDEVLMYNGVRVAPEGTRGYNPAFDVTPAHLISAFVSEAGVFHVNKGETPASKLSAS